MTPAMAAGVTDCLWTIQDIVNLMPAPVAKKRGPYQKNGCVMTKKAITCGFLFAFIIAFNVWFDWHFWRSYEKLLVDGLIAAYIAFWFLTSKNSK